MILGIVEEAVLSGYIAGSRLDSARQPPNAAAAAAHEGARDPDPDPSELVKWGLWILKKMLPPSEDEDGR
jgi:hypothetical protein